MTENLGKCIHAGHILFTATTLSKPQVRNQDLRKMEAASLKESKELWFVELWNVLNGTWQ